MLKKKKYYIDLILYATTCHEHNIFEKVERSDQQKCSGFSMDCSIYNIG